MSKQDEIYYVPAGSPVGPDKFDTRLRMRNLTRGVITPDEVKKFQTSLPDDTDSAEFRSYDEILNREETAAGGTTTH